MAEFQNIIIQLNRLCKMNLNLNSCSNTCPLALLHKKYLDAPSCKEELFVHTKEVEQIVSEWTKEHPEPVYPTWAEWFRQMGVVPSEQKCFHTWLLDQIPADIAQKLGIEPKEG